MSKRKHIIIGCGPAALNAAEKIRVLSPDDEVKLVTSEDILPYSPTALPFLVSRKIQEDSCRIRDEDFFLKNKFVFQRGKRVVQILPEEKRVVYEEGSHESYDRLLIATGSEPVRPDIKGLDEVDFFEFHTMSDCRRLMQVLKGKKEVVIYGGGLVAVELALALTETGLETTIIVRSRILRGYFDHESGTIIERLIKETGVALIDGTTLDEIQSVKEGVKLHLSDGRLMDFELLISCPGVRPRIPFVMGSGIEVSVGILADRGMRTNYPDIFVAGDAAEAPDFFSGARGINPILPGAIEQGKVAGANMAGEDVRYQGWIPANILRFSGNMIFSVGISNPVGEGFETLVQSNRGEYKKMVFHDNRLVGASFVNKTLHPGLILKVIKERMDMRDKKEKLFDDPEHVAPCLIREYESQQRFGKA